jgi:hypothetical protein
LDSEAGSLKYVAAPVWDSERLKAASQDPVLRNELPNPLPSNITDVVFTPLIADASELTLKLSVPRKNVPSVPPRARPGVVKNLTDVFLDEIQDLTIDNLSEIFAALLGKEFGVFTGNVEVGVSGTGHVVSVPFSARLNDLYGPVLEESETPGENGRSSVRLRNVIESPVTVRSIPTHIRRTEELFPAHIENLTKGGVAVAFPVDLAPGEELSLEVLPDQPLPAGAGSPDALFDLDDVQVKIDPPAVWNAILDTSVQPQHTRKIRVQTFADAFVPKTDVEQVSLDFDNGDYVVLDPEHLQAEATIHISVKDLILAQVLGDNVVESEYSYTQTVKRTSSPRPTETRETGSRDLLYPVFNP